MNTTNELRMVCSLIEFRVKITGCRLLAKSGDGSDQCKVTRYAGRLELTSRVGGFTTR